ncbi:glycoside hydrolase family 88 protein [Marinilabilia rubra]|uniref:Glucuronyl hydrolase n=1 Tax=Marinilabilia rubra TaxID=2162893 RepID=A0A2U2BBF4_9BACT|nr:glycoside hydrolase family 88 protein [Marinilabilia rubra]PWE00389.1 glucuronyl hydrolase [Marinilabilia rubra]
MKLISKTFALALFTGLLSCHQAPQQEPMEQVIKRSMKVAQQQSRAMAESLLERDQHLPRTINRETGELITSDSRWWTSGFFPGTLWYVYEYTNNDSIKELAEVYTQRVEREKFTTNNHDVGFMLYCSFGNGLRLTNYDQYPEVLITGSKSLSTRFDENVGLIRSWDFNKEQWQYPVIIDNMMNLELLMWTFKHTGDSTFYNIAVSHADKTLKNHFRNDFSSYHVVSYDTLTGHPHIKMTHQGASDSSLWARGQAWGLYGFTMMYRETGKERYLEQAQNIADLLINHPNLPEDKIPYWDFSAPNIPDEPRDASAAAVMASSLIELSQFSNKPAATQYLDVAEKQLRTLASPKYLAEPGTNGNFILKHSVGSKPHNSEVDVPLTYADYYFLEALLRFRELLQMGNAQTKQK